MSTRTSRRGGIRSLLALAALVVGVASLQLGAPAYADSAESATVDFVQPMSTITTNIVSSNHPSMAYAGKVVVFDRPAGGYLPTTISVRIRWTCNNTVVQDLSRTVTGGGAGGAVYAWPFGALTLPGSNCSLKVTVPNLSPFTITPTFTLFRTAGPFVMSSILVEI